MELKLIYIKENKRLKPVGIYVRVKVVDVDKERIIERVFNSWDDFWDFKYWLNHGTSTYFTEKQLDFIKKYLIKEEI